MARRKTPNLPLLPELATALRTTDGNALARLTGLKLTPVCDRCGGCGQYSFNQVDGTTCYGCGGTGHRYPKPAEMPGLVDSAKEAATDGRLEAYLQVLEARALAKRGYKRIMDVYGSTPMQRIYAGWASHMATQEQVGGNWDEMREATHAGHEAFEAAKAKIRDAQFTKRADPEWAAKQLAAAEAVEEAIRIINDTAVEPSPEVIAFAQPRQRAAAERVRRNGYKPGFKVYGEEAAE